jgi:hypothetical protein
MQQTKFPGVGDGLGAVADSQLAISATLWTVTSTAANSLPT